MTLVTLENALQNAFKNKYAVAGLVTLGWEDMKAFVEAAEKENCPIILQAGPSCRQHTPLPIFCLLYTSPSPRDRQKSRMPSSA